MKILTKIFTFITSDNSLHINTKLNNIKITDNADGACATWSWVNDVNDNSPKLSQQLLTNKNSLTDSDDQIIFEIIEDSYERNGEFIPHNLADFLILDKNTGSLSLLTYVNNNMKAYLEFLENGHYDTT
uniref:Uncharacterized protein n=1 Tax=Glossina palpalis gambiensis TaxID=67801 RepID=A0A1B0C3T4_9MUSC